MHEETIRLRPTTKIRVRSEEEENLLRQELATCRQISTRCCFIFGFARSGTTILAEIINANDRALLTTEANYFIPTASRRFRDWYNDQHVSFGNQICKSTYAPDFIPLAKHSWWQWLEEAGAIYALVGDKIAISDHHFSVASPEQILSFFEARFFLSKHVFTIRHPVQSLASMAKTFDSDNEAYLARNLKAWLTFIKFWAYFIRVFPKTHTIVFDRFDVDAIGPLGDFLDLDLTLAHVLLDPREQRRHAMSDIASGSLLERYREPLDKIFADVQSVVQGDRALLQADQKRESVKNETSTNHGAGISVVSTPAGRIWALADELIHGLVS